MATSQNGYPGLQAGSSQLHKWIIPDADRHFMLRHGSAGFLLAHFILWFHETIQKLNLKGDQWDEWAYAWRDVRGSTTSLSNHASGTAVDLNATRYPLGTMLMAVWRKAKIRLRLRLYRSCLRWGGDYEGRKDEMHVEINRNLAACEKVARRLMKTKRGIRIIKANPGQRQVILS